MACLNLKSKKLNPCFKKLLRPGDKNCFGPWFSCSICSSLFYRICNKTSPDEILRYWTLKSVTIRSRFKKIQICWNVCPLLIIHIEEWATHLIIVWQSQMQCSRSSWSVHPGSKSIKASYKTKLRRNKSLFINNWLITFCKLIMISKNWRGWINMFSIARPLAEIQPIP